MRGLHFCNIYKKQNIPILKKNWIKSVITGPGLYIIQHGNNFHISNSMWGFLKSILWKIITRPFYCSSLFCSLTSLFYGEQSEKEKTPSESSPSDSETKDTVRKKASHTFKKCLIRIFVWIYYIWRCRIPLVSHHKACTSLSMKRET